MTQKRKIGLLIIVFVALICIYMWVRAWNQSEQAQANTMIRITDTEGDKIKKIALNIENGELNFEKENGVWYDALDHDIPLNQSIMNEIADTVGSISANRKLKNADEAKDYGLDVLFIRLSIQMIMMMSFLFISEIIQGTIFMQH